MKTLFANKTENFSFEVLTATELNDVKGGTDRGTKERGDQWEKDDF